MSEMLSFPGRMLGGGGGMGPLDDLLKIAAPGSALEDPAAEIAAAGKTKAPGLSTVSGLPHGFVNLGAGANARDGGAAQIEQLLQSLGMKV